MMTLWLYFIVHASVGLLLTSAAPTNSGNSDSGSSDVLVHRQEHDETALQPGDRVEAPSLHTKANDGDVTIPQRLKRVPIEHQVHMLALNLPLFLQLHDVLWALLIIWRLSGDEPPYNGVADFLFHHPVVYAAFMTWLTARIHAWGLWDYGEEWLNQGAPDWFDYNHDNAEDEILGLDGFFEDHAEDREELGSDQDEEELGSDKDQEELDSDENQEELDSGEDQEESAEDQDEEELGSDQDHEELDSDEDQEELDSGEDQEESAEDQDQEQVNEGDDFPEPPHMAVFEVFEGQEGIDPWDLPAPAGR